MSYFPLMVQLEQAPVLLVGGGRTAFHKARILVDFGACVRVVAPEVLPELEQLPVQVERRPFPGRTWNSRTGPWWWRLRTAGR